MRILSLLKTHSLNFLWPRTCRLCDSPLDETENFQICSACLNYISPLSEEERFIFHKEYLKKHINASYIVAHFDNHTRPILHDLKYNHVKSNGYLMAHMIYNTFKNQLIDNSYDAVFSCPMHPVKELAREYNQADLIAGKIALSIDVPFDKGSLKRLRNTKTQTKLNKFQREKNLQNAFHFETQKNYQKILIIDDVITTGMTFIKISESIKGFDPNIKIDVAAFATPYFN